ncbi:MAG TPA: 3-oxoadipate enol-lactonase [Candidatus Dormibacteraeota bacterium]
MAEAVELNVRWDGPEGAPVLVLSHAIGLSIALWDAQVESFSRDFRVLRYDHRGHGGSRVPPGPYRIEDLGGDLVALLDRLGLERVSLCGLSLGGMVGMWFAANAPDRVERLVLCCTAARMPQPEIYTERAERVRREGLEPIADAVIARWFTPAFVQSHPDEVDAIRRLFVSANPEGYASTCEALAAMDLRPDLARINAPTLILAGGSDQATPIEQSRLIAERIDGSTLVVLENAAHLANVEQPKAFANAVLSGLRR